MDNSELNSKDVAKNSLHISIQTTKTITTTLKSSSKYPVISINPPNPQRYSNSKQYPLANNKIPQILSDFLLDLPEGQAVFKTKSTNDESTELKHLLENHSSVLENHYNNDIETKHFYVNNNNDNIDNYYEIENISSDSKFEKKQPKITSFYPKTKKITSFTENNNTSLKNSIGSTKHNKNKLNTHTENHEHTNTLENTNIEKIDYAEQNKKSKAFYNENLLSNDNSNKGNLQLQCNIDIYNSVQADQNSENNSVKSIDNTKNVYSSSKLVDISSSDPAFGIYKLPEIMDTYEKLPKTLQMYMLSNLLNLSHSSVLQFASMTIKPTLKRDFIGLLPVELSQHIMRFMDIKSLCAASCVNTNYQRIFEGYESSQIWHDRLYRSGFWEKKSQIKASVATRLGIKETSNFKPNEINNLSENDFYLESELPFDHQNICSQSNEKKTRLTECTNIKKEFSNGLIHRNTSDDEIYHPATPTHSVPESPSQNMKLHSKKSFLEDLENIDKNLAPCTIFKQIYESEHKVNTNWNRGEISRVTFPGNGADVVTCLHINEGMIIAGFENSTIFVYDATTGATIRRLEGHDGGVWALSIVGNTLVSGSTDRTVRVWNINTGECTHVFTGHNSTVRCLKIMLPKDIRSQLQIQQQFEQKYEPDSPLIVTGSRDSTLRVWRLPETQNEYSDNNKTEFSKLYQPTTPNHGVDNSQAVNTAINSRSSTSIDKDAYFVHLLKGHTLSVRALTTLGRYIISGSYDTTVRVWDSKTGSCTFVLTGHSDKVYAVSSDKENRTIASSSLDGTVRLWSIDSGECLHVLSGHNALVGLLGVGTRSVYFKYKQNWQRKPRGTNSQINNADDKLNSSENNIVDPRDSMLISAGADNSIRLWDLQSGKLIKTLSGHTGPITCFHSNSTRLVSGGDTTLKLWDLRTGKFVRNLLEGLLGVWQVKFDDKRLVVAVRRQNGIYFEVFDFGKTEQKE
ncbi:hypothetical protein BB558_001213 [Smittium angustum]|uniref:F-box domain-containing protein n=1 Tax=Smittium angustum TaxID=133377 RepID=A0A2U1JCG5_SMIAN|nr:hypothetical protein BB558_001213 [Smittium angustum]